MLIEYKKEFHSTFDMSELETYFVKSILLNESISILDILKFIPRFLVRIHLDIDTKQNRFAPDHINVE